MPDPLDDIFSEDDPLTPSESDSDADRRRKTREELRKRGAALPYSDTELLDLIAEILGEEGEFAGPETAEDAFRAGLESGAGVDAFRSTSRAGEKRSAFEDQRDTILDQLIGLYTDKGGSGPTPSVIQLPDNNDIFREVTGVATGPSPSSLFRDVYQNAFPDLTQAVSPFAKFVQGQEQELENRFLQQVFNEFTQPGYAETLKNDYAALERQGDNQRIAGTGGTIPSYQDYIRGRVKSNYMQFLAGEKPKLEQAFQLASPKERGQLAPGDRYQPKRIL